MSRLVQLVSYCRRSMHQSMISPGTRSALGNSRADEPQSAVEKKGSRSFTI